VSKKKPASDDVYRAKGEGKFVKNPNFGEDPPTAKMDEALVGRTVDELCASGGDCPIVSFYQPDTKLGGLVHVSAEHAGDDYHKTMIDGLLANFEFPSNSKVHIMMDLEGLGKEKAERQAWLDKIEAHLKAKGFNEPKICTSSEGKNVTLDAATGRLIVEDGDFNPLLEEDLTDH